MPKYIDVDEFVKIKREWYCEQCLKRKGMKRGKLQFVYEIGGAPCRACDVDDMISDIEDFPAADVEPKQSWIPVTERLPEDGTYLITWKNHTAQGVCMAYYGYYQDGLHRSSKPDFYRYDNEWGDVTFDDVTHWMPIPEPPKGEDHEIL